MKTKLTNLTIIIITILLSILLFLNKNLIFNTISHAINIWLTNLVPALFPFFIISDILISYDAASFISKICHPLIKFFKIKKEAFIIFIMSIISGFPSNARNTRNLYDQSLIDEKEAAKLLTFTHFSNPLFILGTISTFYLHNQTAGFIILISHYLSNFIIGFIFRNTPSSSNKITSINYRKISFGKVILTSIKSSIDALLTILGILTFFLIITTLITKMLNLSLLSSALFKSFFEITLGLESLSKLNITLNSKIILTTMFLSFGSLSIHMQTYSYICDTKIKYIPYFVARVMHAAISSLIAYLILEFLPL